MENSPAAGTMPWLYERDVESRESCRREAAHVRVHSEPALPHESQERHIELPREVHGQRGRGADRGEDRDPRQHRLRDDLDALVAAHPVYRLLDRVVRRFELLAYALVPHM